MVSVETVRCHKVGRIVLYPMPNKLLPPKKLTHCVLLIFYPFRDKKEVLLVFHQYIQTNSQNNCPGCCKQKQNKS